MASVTPGYTFTGSTDPITFSKLNLLGQPTVSIGANEVTSAKLAANLTLSGNTTISGDLAVTGSITDSLGKVRAIPQNAKTSSYVLLATDNGQHISITTGGVTVPASVFSVGDVVTIFNNSSSSQTITQGTSVTMRNAGTAGTGNRTLAQYGLATVLCVGSNTFVISGSGLT